MVAGGHVGFVGHLGAFLGDSGGLHVRGHAADERDRQQERQTARQEEVGAWSVTSVAANVRWIAALIRWK